MTPWSRLRHSLRQRHWAAAGYMFGWAALSRLPELGARVIATVGADIASRRGRQPAQLRRNLERVLGSGQVSPSLMRASMRSYTRYWMEAFRLPRIASDPSLVRVLDESVEGYDHLLEPLAAGKGVILTLPHSGNWDMAGVLLVHRNGSFTTVAERLEPVELYEAFVDYRTSLGFRVLPHRDARGHGPYEELKNTLARGGVVCLLGERDLRASGVEVEFFGEPALFPAGPARLAMDTGASLHVVHSFYPDSSNWGLRVSEALEVDDVQSTTQRIAEGFEANIAAHPHDWHMLQPLWLADLDPHRLARGRAQQQPHEADAARPSGLDDAPRGEGS
ncbi:Phosphatidylinositol mannoside acyltransferase [Corynebacterium ciconiae DSM 44920]|uniref:phosphatidylinositol mannoside acyltransferase n=1 Tax=Corynebacterium ciconiae TaxID=227319 RepID=UPI0003AA7DA8|nr:phosphatidylinositol mannoside acyltransferase [Corynebacterium ciconiae]WKD61345.1 Phosphatidylinositol mannoside acyltransferase [Corynebacterium ciconiae DSM 44920]